VRELSYSLAYLISYISSLFTLEAGDLIVTGTPAGVGPMQAGDEVAVELSCGVRLHNPVE
jgi:2-keto-4-pentenoate hydratase/2-oxohepta-3-ene-1,7-dioic acid hydratase in catechol pathway